MKIAKPVKQSNKIKPNTLGIILTLKALFRYIKNYKWQYYLIALLILIDSAYQGLVPLIYKNIFDDIFVQDIKTIPFILMSVLAVGFVIFAFVNVYSRYVAAKVGAQIIKDIRVSLLQNFLGLPTRLQSSVKSGELINHFNNNLIMMEQALVLQLPLVFQYVLRVFIGIALIFYLQWFLALIMLILIPLLMFISKPLLKKSNQFNELLKKQEARMTNQIQESIALASVISVFNLIGKINSKFEHTFKRLKTISIKANANTTFAGKIAATNIDLIMLLTILFSVILIVKGYFTVGSVIAFLASMLMLGNAAAMLAMLFPQITNLLVGLGRIEIFLKKYDSILKNKSTINFDENIHNITFDNVSFSYDGHTSALRDVNFSIKAGESVGIVGMSGAGKSSVILMLLKQYQPTAGQILINKYDLADLNKQSWLSCLGVVFQESLLFSTSVYENIRMGKLNASEEEVILAAKKAHIHDFIMSLPHQYDTKIGKQESNDLSGGQRQRIAIARALIRKPAILLLDEITSALDANSEAAINDVIEEVKKECTVIVIAHHFKGLKLLDKILLLDQGKLVDAGTHETLIEKNALYSQLWNKQQ